MMFTNLKEALANPKECLHLRLGLRTEELPSEFEQLINLETLILNSKKMKVLSSSLAGLKKLKVLEVNCPELKNIEILGDTILENFKVASSRIQSLSPLPKTLKVLQINQSSLKEWPIDLFNHSLLKDLNLRNNKLTTIPNEITSLRGLKRLVLAQNQIKKINPVLKELPLLNYLSLDGNPLEQESLDWIFKQYGIWHSS